MVTETQEPSTAVLEADDTEQSGCRVEQNLALPHVLCQVLKPDITHRKVVSWNFVQDCSAV